MRAAERREKVVERVFVRDVNRRQLELICQSIPVEEVVMADSEIEQVSVAPCAADWHRFQYLTSPTTILSCERRQKIVDATTKAG